MPPHVGGAGLGCVVLPAGGALVPPDVEPPPPGGVLPPPPLGAEPPPDVLPPPPVPVPLGVGSDVPPGRAGSWIGPVLRLMSRFLAAPLVQLSSVLYSGSGEPPSVTGPVVNVDVLGT